MKKNNKGFTLIEVIVTLGLVVLVIAGCSTIINTVNVTNRHANEFSEGQQLAQSISDRIEDEIRYANYIYVIDTDSPKFQNKCKYFYVKDNNIYENSLRREDIKISTNSPIIRNCKYNVDFERESSQVLRVTVYVYDGKNLVYKLTRDIYASNMNNFSILGKDEGHILAYQVVYKSFKLIKSLSVIGANSLAGLGDNKPTISQYTVNIDPTDATDNEIVWYVYDIDDKGQIDRDSPDRASIDDSGNLTAFGNGKVRITTVALDGSNVMASKDVMLNCGVYIKKITIKLPIMDGSSDGKSVNGNGALGINNARYPIVVTYDPSYATDKRLKWTINQPWGMGCSISDDGVLSVPWYGWGFDITIFAAAQDGGGAPVASLNVHVNGGWFK